MKRLTIIASAIAALTTTPASAASYDIFDLGALFPSGSIGGWNYDIYSYGNDINNSGQVTGVACKTGFSNCDVFLYGNGSVSTIGNSYYYTQSSINNNGSVVFRNNPMGGSSTNDINDSGQTTGSIGSHRYNQLAFLNDGSNLTILGTLSSTTFGTPMSWGNAINNLGQVTGHASRQTEGMFSAFVYSNGSMTDIGILLGGGFSSGNDINDSGQVTGVGGGGAFLYSNGSMKNIGSGTGVSINNNGWVVGNDGNNGPFIYTSGRLNLNSLIDANSGWVLTEANGINDIGSIVGTGFINGQQHAYIATLVGTLPDVFEVSTIPEPEAYAMLLAGLGLVGFSARRKKP